MKRWRVWLALLLVACIPILVAHSGSPALLKDTDTAALLQATRARQAPLSWFSGDWPLQNHFYRPFPTLAFELDDRLWHNWAEGYGWTNAAICFVCVFALFWLVREMTDSPPIAFASSLLFALWTLNYGPTLASWCYWIAPLALIAGLLRHGRKARNYLPASLAAIFLGTLLDTDGLVHDVAGRTMNASILDWLPGRTASVMTLFALAAMAAYGRYERLSAAQEPLPKATALDKPLRRAATSSARAPWIWAVVAFLLGACALASYEQAIMLPACLTGLGVYFLATGRKPHWWMVSGFWLLLLGYIELRHALIPGTTSRYQAQQLRFGWSVYRDILDYSLPNLTNLYAIWIVASSGIGAFFFPGLSGLVLTSTSSISTAFQVRRHWVLVVTGLALSTVAFLPMAWVKFFAHYHYWPFALRTLLVVGVAQIAWELLITAASPPALQAPPRRVPAPGSLPHR